MGTWTIRGAPTQNPNSANGIAMKRCLRRNQARGLPVTVLQGAQPLHLHSQHSVQDEAHASSILMTDEKPRVTSARVQVSYTLIENQHSAKARRIHLIACLAQ